MSTPDLKAHPQTNPPPTPKSLRRAWTTIIQEKPLQHAVDAVQYGIALVLIIVAVIVLVRSLYFHRSSFPRRDEPDEF
jgi:hypothetical protein